MINAILAGHDAIKILCKAQQELVDRCAKEKMVLPPKDVSEAHEKLAATIKEVIYTELYNTLHTPMVKTDHYPAMAALEEKPLQTTCHYSYW